MVPGRGCRCYALDNASIRAMSEPALDNSQRSIALPLPQTPSRAWRDEDLVEECRRGNEQAWGAVVDKYKNLVYSIPLKYHMSPEDAADVLQDVWVVLYSELKNLRKPGALGGWLLSVASNRCYQWKRRKAWVARQQQISLDREPLALDPAFPSGRKRQSGHRSCATQSRSCPNAANAWCSCCSTRIHRCRMRMLPVNWGWPKAPSGSSGADVSRNCAKGSSDGASEVRGIGGLDPHECPCEW